MLRRIIYGWSNEGWSAKANLFQALLTERFDRRTSVLECGTGLSTILLSIIAARTRASLVALEHDEIWHELVCQRLSAFGLPSEGIKLAPLRSYGEFDWHDAPSILDARDRFNLVLCDGPPRSTRGGR